MPNLNGTGPKGNGPMTGRGLGNCNSDNNDSEKNLEFGKRNGNGRKNGRGRNRR